MRQRKVNNSDCLYRVVRLSGWPWKQQGAFVSSVRSLLFTTRKKGVHGIVQQTVSATAVLPGLETARILSESNCAAAHQSERGLKDPLNQQKA